MHEFDRATHVELLTPGTYRASTSERFWNAHGPFGGTTAGVIVRALHHGAVPGESVASLTLHYLDSISKGDFEIQLESERQTSSFRFVRVAVRQADQLKLSGVALLARAREEPTYQTLQAPRGLMQREVLARWTAGEVLANFTREFHYDMVEGVPLAGQSELRSAGWIALKEPRPLDSVLLAAYADAWPPVLWTAFETPTVFSTLVMQVLFRVAPERLPEQRAPLFVHLTSSLAAAGLVDERQDVWSADGTQLCQTTQLCRYTARAPQAPHLSGYRRARREA